MGPRIRVHPIDGVSAAVALVCDMSAAEGQTPSGAVLVPVTDLTETLATIDRGVDTIVFLTADDVKHLDPAAVGIVRLIEGLRNAPDHVAAVRRVPAVNATKRVRDGVVVEAVDRDTLNLLRSPEVVDRQVLDSVLAALAPPGTDASISPTVLAASGGGRVLVLDDDQAVRDSTNSFNAAS